MNNFTKAVKEEFNAIISKYDFSFHVLRDNEIILKDCKSRFMLSIAYQFYDGIYLRYLFQKDGEIYDCDLSIFLWKIRDATIEVDESISDKMIKDLRADANLLLKYADDILSGEKDWLKDYPYKPSLYSRDQNVISDLIQKT